MPFQRSSGILLHPSSLPSRGGIGDFGPAAYQFVDFLAAARQKVWQVLPLGPTGMGNSPYSSTSAFAGNPLLVSLELLAQAGWIGNERLSQLPSPSERVDFEAVKALKMPLLREAARNFLGHASPQDRERFGHFRAENQNWLDGFVLFDVLRQRHHAASWSSWPRELVRRDAATLEKIRSDAAEELEVERVIQFAFFEQWNALRRACHAKGIQIVGDIAIFVSYDSADVWTHPDIFYLKPDGHPEFVAGVPPDAFSKTGQRWGNPVYRWEVLKARGYDWWVERIRGALKTCDILRLDHFRGFEQYWQIPAGDATAEHGRWMPGPGDDLFNALRHHLGELPFIAEDLGFITPEVHALRERLSIPGMKVLQFGFSDPGAHMYLPHRYDANCVVYTGTHDNDTTVGWWRNGASEAERAAVKAYLGDGSGEQIHWALVRAAATSIAGLCLLPMQDALGLGSEARMNIPSHADGNWAWRLMPHQLTPEVAKQLAELTVVSDRA